MLHDCRFALRVFRRQPVLYATAAFGFALAIGISSALFTFINLSVIRGSGVRDRAGAFLVRRDSAFRTSITGTALPAEVREWSGRSGARAASTKE
jgi:hypothetical protein